MRITRHAFRTSFIRLAPLLVLTVLVTPSRAASPQEKSAGELLEQFKNTKIFWQQLEVAKKLVRFHDATLLHDPTLVAMLTSEDRHLRGNAAFVFARLGDDRGFQILRATLNDQSERPMDQGVPTGPSSMKQQIRADRYYAVHLFGELKDARAVSLLVPLLRDGDVDVKAKAAWALGEIGDGYAIEPLVGALDDKELRVRAAATEAIEKLRVKQLLPPHRLAQ